MTTNYLKKYPQEMIIYLFQFKQLKNLFHLLILKKYHQSPIKNKESVKIKGKISDNHSAKCKKKNFQSKNNIPIKYHLQFRNHKFLQFLIKLKRVKTMDRRSLKLTLNHKKLKLNQFLKKLSRNLKNHKNNKNLNIVKN